MKINRYVFWLLLMLGFSGLGVLLYWPARNGAWVLDDIPNILLNLQIRNISDFFHFFVERRGIPFFTFALNIKFWGLEPAAFRWVNVAIHVANSLLVVVLLRQLTGSAWRWAIAGGLFFLCHPVQTSAVDYIVQRMTLLSAFFALIAIILVDRYYILHGEGRRLKAGIILLFSVFCGIFSVMSKENTVLLPLLMFLLAWLKGGGRLVSGWKPVFVLWLSILVVGVVSQYSIAVQYILGASTNSEVTFYKDTGKILYEVMGNQDRAFLSARYFLSQLEVFWVYLGLIVLPLRQALDYSWPIPDLRFSLLHLSTLALLVIGFWFTFKRRQRFPYLFFGVAWIIVCIVIESSIIPLDPIFEHRLYLPLIGILFILRDLGPLLPPKAGWNLAVVAICLLAVLSWKRNEVWGSDLAAFWQNNVKIVPRAPRPAANLAEALFTQKRFSEALEVVKPLRELHHMYDMTAGEVLYFSGNTEEAMSAFHSAVRRGEPGANGVELFNGYQALQEKRYAEAGEWLERAQRLKGQDVKAFYFKGMLAEAQKDPVGAVENYNSAILASESWYEAGFMSVNSGYKLWAQERRDFLIDQLSSWLDLQRASLKTAGANISQRLNFANQLMRLGLNEEALTNYEVLKTVMQKNWSLYYKLGIVSEKLRKFREAEEYFKASYEMAPNNKDSAFHYARILMNRSNLAAAEEVLALMLQQSPDDGRFLLLSGDVNWQRGKISAARAAYQRASLQPGYQGLGAAVLMDMDRKEGGKK